MVAIQKEENIKKLQVSNKIYYYGVSSKPNVGIIGISVSMRKQHNFEIIFTSEDVLNIQYAIGKGFGYRERTFSMGVNYYFGPIRTNRPHASPNYETGQPKFEIDYYRQKYFSPENDSYMRKVEKEGKEVMYSSKSFNYNYMEFVGYETCEKLIWTSGEGIRFKK